MRETGTAVRQESWAAWPVFWTAVWVGALASVVAVILFGLAGTAFGAYKAGAEGRITSFSGIGLPALVFAVFGSFLSFVIGGWIAARVAGIGRAEPAMLHGAIAFLVGTVILVALASFGGAVFNGWYVALAPYPSFRYVVAVTAEHGGFGADTAAPEARKILAALFGIKNDKGPAPNPNAGAAGVVAPAPATVTH